MIRNKINIQKREHEIRISKFETISKRCMTKQKECSKRDEAESVF
jgi:hypothetical protein